MFIYVAGLAEVMDQAYKNLLTKQGYAFVGEHSAVKVCEWTKKSIRGQGVCYKNTFYGIDSHQCVQMSPAVNMCTMDCVYCWRERNETGFGTSLDDPEKVIDHAIQAQIDKLQGFHGSASADPQKLKEMESPKHFAISLTGEPTAYPYLGKLIAGLHKRGITSFLVTNGQFPDALERLDKEDCLPTQVYLSFDHPDEQAFTRMDRPDLPDAWQRLMRSVDFLKRVKNKTRTVFRITLVKGMNDNHHEGFATVIERADPWFLEVKGYMFVGASRQRLTIENMPRHEDAVAFANELSTYCEYKIVSDQPASRAVLMMREDHPDRMMKCDGIKTRFPLRSVKNRPLKRAA